MFGKLVDLVGGTKAKIVVALLVVVGCYGGYKWIYNTGYQQGVDVVTNQVRDERIQWEAKIATLQAQHNTAIATLNQQHKDRLNTLQHQLDALNDQRLQDKYFDPSTLISNGFVVWHNRCANGAPLNNFITEIPSGKYTVKDVANSVAINYNNCNVCIDRLTKLQTIVKQFIEKQNQVTK